MRARFAARLLGTEERRLRTILRLPGNVKSAEALAWSIGSTRSSNDESVDLVSEGIVDGAEAIVEPEDGRARQL